MGQITKEDIKMVQREFSGQFKGLGIFTFIYSSIIVVIYIVYFIIALVKDDQCTIQLDDEPDTEVHSQVKMILLFGIIVHMGQQAQAIVIGTIPK